jgi:hypothetical protein
LRAEVYVEEEEALQKYQKIGKRKKKGNFQTKGRNRMTMKCGIE